MAAVWRTLKTVVKLNPSSVQALVYPNWGGKNWFICTSLVCPQPPFIAQDSPGREVKWLMQLTEHKSPALGKCLQICLGSRIPHIFITGNSFPRMICNVLLEPAPLVTLARVRVLHPLLHSSGTICVARTGTREMLYLDMLNTPSGFGCPGSLRAFHFNSQS